MNIPTLKPEQYIVFSSEDDSFGIGNIIPVQVKDIITWEHDELGDKEVRYREPGQDDGDDDYYLSYYDFQIMPPDWNPDWEQQREMHQTLIEWLNSPKKV